MAGKQKFVVDKEVLRSMYQTMTMKKIAEHFGVGETVVWKRVHDFGIVLEGFEVDPRRRPKKFSEAHLQAMKEAGVRRRGKWSGQNNPNWRGGRSEQNLALRRSGAYKQWKIDSLKLAQNKCQQCGVEKDHVCDCCGQKTVLHVHHVKSFAKHEELRFDPNNSEVLCAKCHHSRHFGKIG